jgi:hypothetical protein
MVKARVEQQEDFGCINLQLVFYILLLTVLISFLSSLQAISADLLSNSLQQRIGDYDVRINTIPITPISGEDTRINIMITTVSNNPITDTPITIRISDEKGELVKSQPILLSNGHHSYNHKFDKSGLFLLSIDILENPLAGDSSDSNKLVTFDFPIRISEPISADIANLAVPITIAAAAGSVMSFIIIRKSKKNKNFT